MKSTKTIVFALLSIFILPLCVHAADDDLKTESAGVQTEVDAEGAVEESKGIISQSSPIVGYQALTVAGQEIEATYLEEVLGERHGAIIFLHDQGERLEGKGVVTPLRHQLPKYGWSTLTLALDYPYEPAILLSTTLIIDNNASEAALTAVAGDEKSKDSGAQAEKEALPPISNQQRLKAAITFLQEKDIDRILFIGHGAGGNLAVEILDDETTPIQALILISTPELSTNEVFKTMQHPILELYGAQDLDGIAEAVQHRKVLMKRAGNKHYAIREIVAANHFFTGLETTLVNSIRGWLKSTFLDEKKE